MNRTAKIATGGLCIGGLITLLYATKSKPAQKYSCPFCPEVFDTYEQLLEHMANEHPGEEPPPEPSWEAEVSMKVPSWLSTGWPRSKWWVYREEQVRTSGPGLIPAYSTDWECDTGWNEVHVTKPYECIGKVIETWVDSFSYTKVTVTNVRPYGLAIGFEIWIEEHIFGLDDANVRAHLQAEIPIGVPLTLISHGVDMTSCFNELELVGAADITHTWVHAREPNRLFARLILNDFDLFADTMLKYEWLDILIDLALS